MMGSVNLSWCGHSALRDRAYVGIGEQSVGIAVVFIRNDSAVTRRSVVIIEVFSISITVVVIVVSDVQYALAGMLQCL